MYDFIILYDYIENHCSGEGQNIERTSKHQLLYGV